MNDHTCDQDCAHTVAIEGDSWVEWCLEHDCLATLRDHGHCLSEMRKQEEVDDE